MRMTIRQYSDLVKGRVVSERDYNDDGPEDILGVLLLVIQNCINFIEQEGIPIVQSSVGLEKLTLRYPGVAGMIEVVLYPE